MVGLFLGMSFLGLIVLVIWSTLGSPHEKRKSTTFSILLMLILSWAILLYFGISHTVGLSSMYAGLIISVASLLVPLFHKAPLRLEDKVMKELEQAYIQQYKEWSDTTYGPSLLGTMNDYNRLLLSVLEPLEEKYPEISYFYEEIIERLKEITPQINT